MLIHMQSIKTDGQTSTENEKSKTLKISETFNKALPVISRFEPGSTFKVRFSTSVVPVGVTTCDSNCSQMPSNCCARI